MNAARHMAHRQQPENGARQPQHPDHPMELAPETGGDSAPLSGRALNRLSVAKRYQHLKWVLITLSVATTSLLVLWLELLRSPLQ